MSSRSLPLLALLWACGTTPPDPSKDAGASLVDSGSADGGDAMDGGDLMDAQALTDAGTEADAGVADGGACTPVAAAEDTVRVRNAWGDIVGSLYLPDHCGPIPVVLIVGASDGYGTDRDGNIPEAGETSDVYRWLAVGFGEHGIGVLRYDWPGIRESTRAYPPRGTEYLFDDEVTDAARWISFLRADPRVSKIIVAGHSSGALTALLAARAVPADGLISLEGPGRPAGRLLMAQLRSRLSGADYQRLSDAIAALEGGLLPGPLAPPLDQYLPVAAQPYCRSWFHWDPKLEIASAGAPVLIVQGTTDTQVFQEDAQWLLAGAPTGELLLVEGMCHLLKAAALTAAAQRAAHQDPTLPLAAGLMEPMAAFVHRLNAQ